jgi:hypothetical protein
LNRSLFRAGGGSGALQTPPAPRVRQGRTVADPIAIESYGGISGAPILIILDMQNNLSGFRFSETPVR